MKKTPSPTDHIWKVVSCAFMQRTLLLVMQGLLISHLQAQGPVKYDVFYHPTFNNLTFAVPKPYEFTPIANASIFPPVSRRNPDQSIQEAPSTLPTLQMPHTPEQVRMAANIERDLMETDFYRKMREHEDATRAYRQAFSNLSKLNPNHFSLTRAVYEVENAFLDNKLDYSIYEDALRIRADQVMQIIKRQKLSNNDLALNYAIQQLFEHPNSYFNVRERRMYVVPPFKYDLEDYEGKKDYTKVLTTKMLGSGNGQCHSMPLVYLMIAEHLGAKAWLSLAPQHSFIQFKDGKGRLMNFETTNGNIVSVSWLAASGYINGKAVRSNTYLDTLSQRQLYARCLSDLLLSYLHKFGYDEFSAGIKQRILELEPQNITALIVDANLKREMAWKEIQAAGRPKEEDLPKFTVAYKAYQDMQAAIKKVDDLGYQDMPPEAYQAWLKSIEQEKQRQATRTLRERMEREVRQLRSTFQNKKN
jgi:hypothetical protein